ncbi:MAG: ribose 5-phosphate isomerase B [Anaerolineae bacterium]|nr:ribose 5-phosphate isomerase B [Thermoflexales bacterium]MDW8395176.1 ribose 5-phosphate isomerase B [Anaerolineae bacterium]
MAEKKVVLLGCDEAAFSLKEVIKAHLQSKGIEVIDYGVHTPDPVDYPDIAVQVARDVAAGRSDRAILMCGTGIGMAITANKVPGVYAALAHDTYSAERARKSNNAQVLTMGARVIGPELAKQIVDAWLASEFQGGNSARKVAKIAALEQELAARNLHEGEDTA